MSENRFFLQRLNAAILNNINLVKISKLTKWTVPCKEAFFKAISIILEILLFESDF